MRQRRRALLAAAVLWTGGVRAQAPAPVPPPEVATALPGARLQGQGRLRFLGMRIYDARLWVGAPVVGTDWAAVPLALELEYARSLKGALIAERSLLEIRRQGALDDGTAARWLQAMQRLFPDVAEGDRLVAGVQPGQGLRLWGNGKLLGEMAEPVFAQRFLGIWLSASTSEPALRLALLGPAGP